MAPTGPRHMASLRRRRLLLPRPRRRPPPALLRRQTGALARPDAGGADSRQPGPSHPKRLGVHRQSSANRLAKVRRLARRRRAAARRGETLRSVRPRIERRTTTYTRRASHADPSRPCGVRGGDGLSQSVAYLSFNPRRRRIGQIHACPPGRRTALGDRRCRARPSGCTVHRCAPE